MPPRERETEHESEPHGARPVFSGERTILALTSICTMPGVIVPVVGGPGPVHLELVKRGFLLPGSSEARPGSRWIKKPSVVSGI